MTTVPNSLRAMPDIAAEADLANAGALDWVGMQEIAVPLRLSGPEGELVQSPARVDAQVNLKREDARGIHMSRLYLHVDQHLSNEPLTPCSLRRLLRDFLDSHADLSDRARIRGDGRVFGPGRRARRHDGGGVGRWPNSGPHISGR